MEALLITLAAIAAVFAIIIVLVVIGIYNGIVGGKNRVKRAWADVIAYQMQKMKVIPELDKGMKDYGKFEQDTFTKVAEVRSAVAKLSGDAINPKLLEVAERASQSLLTGLRATFEAYPELKASELYKKWMNALEEIQQNITAAITIFNETVEDFNNSIMTFPSNVVNNALNKETELTTFTDSAAQGEFEYKPFA